MRRARTARGFRFENRCDALGPSAGLVRKALRDAPEGRFCCPCGLPRTSGIELARTPGARAEHAVAPLAELERPICEELLNAEDLGRDCPCFGSRPPAS